MRQSELHAPKMLWSKPSHGMKGPMPASKSQDTSPFLWSTYFFLFLSLLKSKSFRSRKYYFLICRFSSPSQIEKKKNLPLTSLHMILDLVVASLYFQTHSQASIYLSSLLRLILRIGWNLVVIWMGYESGGELRGAEKYARAWRLILRIGWNLVVIRMGYESGDELRGAEKLFYMIKLFLSNKKSCLWQSKLFCSSAEQYENFVDFWKMGNDLHMSTPFHDPKHSINTPYLLICTESSKGTIFCMLALTKNNSQRLMRSRNHKLYPSEEKIVEVFICGRSFLHHSTHIWMPGLGKPYILSFFFSVCLFILLISSFNERIIPLIGLEYNSGQINTLGRTLETLPVKLPHVCARKTGLSLLNRLINCMNTCTFQLLLFQGLVPSGKAELANSKQKNLLDVFTCLSLFFVHFSFIHHVCVVDPTFQPFLSSLMKQLD
ncbi:hypothetical protein VP01_2161g1 [Puccinia sorghi]|uniref:Uncharacterized protein n=1 Tax=Puccinia sorghi TaxID=27349 RepID=A0A0L6VBD4_9BASI|nr:hypothetical protein VP01_2161g1 [Puccinia sorghi]